MSITIDKVKHAARALRAEVAADGCALTHSRALEIVARQLGFSDWNHASAELTPTQARLGPPVPVLRVQDWGPAEQFYVGYLGFAVEWVHRFEPTLPAYARLQRDHASLDLSEHHGDGTPGSVVWLPTADVGALARELRRRPHPRLRPSVDRDAPGGPTLEVVDPFANVLRFCQPEE